MPDRNFVVGIVGNAMKAFQAGKYAEAEKMMNEFDTINKANVTAGAMGLQQAQHQLQERRFGQTVSEFETATLPESQERIAGQAQTREFAAEDRERREGALREAGEFVQQNPRLAGIAKSLSVEGLSALPEILGALRGTREGVEFLKGGGPEVVGRGAIEVAGQIPRREEAEITEIESRIEENEARAIALLFKKEADKSDDDQARDALIKAGRTPEEADIIVGYATEAKLGIRSDAESLDTQIRLLQQSIANVRTGATVKEIADAAAAASGIDPAKAALLRSILGGDARMVRTDVDKQEAITDLTALLTAFTRQRNLIPGTVPLQTGVTGKARQDALDRLK